MLSCRRPPSWDGGQPRDGQWQGESNGKWCLLDDLFPNGIHYLMDISGESMGYHGKSLIWYIYHKWYTWYYASGWMLNGEVVELWTSTLIQLMHYWRIHQILSFGMPTFWPTLFGRFFPPLLINPGYFFDIMGCNLWIYHWIRMWIIPVNHEQHPPAWKIRQGRSGWIAAPFRGAAGIHRRERLHNCAKSPCYSWENSLFLWPISIANS